MGKWKFFLDGWPDFFGTVLTVMAGYFSMILLVRLSGKRTLAKWNVFDFISVVALGSIVADLALSPEVPLARGVLGFAVLIGLQVAISKLACFSGSLERLVNGRPVLLVKEGQFLREAMRRERVTEEELRAAMRGRGLARVAEVYALVLETDGSFSLITENPAPGGSADTLVDVKQDGAAKLSGDAPVGGRLAR
jgi:uncharacterized membrane protein YcaP (DUF421 family)